MAADTIVSSSYTAGPAQVDGRIPIREKHIDSRGYEHFFEYLADENVDPDIVLAERAAHIVRTFEIRAASTAIAIGSAVALTKFEFLNRFTVSERVAIRTAQESNPIVRDFMMLLDMSDHVHLPLAQPGLNYLASVNLLTPERALEIGTE